MIGIWYFNAVSEKWALFEECRQDCCEERLAAIRASGLRYGHYKIARRQPTAKPPRHTY